MKSSDEMKKALSAYAKMEKPKYPPPYDSRVHYGVVSEATLRRLSLIEEFKVGLSPAHFRAKCLATRYIFDSSRFNYMYFDSITHDVCNESYINFPISII